jgi:hypothetical protein
LLETKTRCRYDEDIIMECNGVLAEIKVDLVKDIIGGELDVVIAERDRINDLLLKEALDRREKTIIKSLSDLIVIK